MTVEDLKEYGLTEMTDEEIGNFLHNEGYGVLGLPDDPLPYLIPMSFGYDGDSALYFSFFVGDGSRKQDLVSRAEGARFLAFSVDGTFAWESVVLSGPIAEVSPDEWEDHQVALENAWHLDILEQADSPGSIRLYEFTVRDQRGLKHSGLPPGLADQTGDSREH